MRLSALCAAALFVAAMGIAPVQAQESAPKLDNWCMEIGFQFRNNSESSDYVLTTARFAGTA
jgi:hypothetical protein